MMNKKFLTIGAAALAFTAFAAAINVGHANTNDVTAVPTYKFQYY